MTLPPELREMVERNGAAFLDRYDDLRRLMGLPPLLEHRRTPRQQEPAPDLAAQAAPPSAPPPSAPPAGTAAEAGSAAGKIAAVRPPLYSQRHIALPVPYPDFDEMPTGADRAMGLMLVAFDAFGSLAQEVNDLLDTGVEVAHRLQWRCVREFQRCRSIRAEILPLIEDFADNGEALLAAALAEGQKHNPKLRIDDLYHQRTSPALAATLTPMAWVVQHASPPFPICFLGQGRASQSLISLLERSSMTRK